MTMREREWIRRFVRPRAPNPIAGDALLGPGDDAALLALPPGEVAVLTIDGMVAGRHFRPGWLADDELAARLVAVTVSDLAAMGATPRGILLSFETPELPGQLGPSFFAGLDRVLSRSGPLLGGNVVRTDGPLALTATAIGSVEPGRALRRDAARPGDTLAISGVPGRAASARMRIAEGVREENARTAWVLPPDRVPLGRALGEHGVRAAVDVSDGLAADLSQLLDESGVGADLDLGPLARAAEHDGIDLSTALGGGEDYELLVAGEETAITAAFEAAGAGAPLILGTVRTQTGMSGLVDGSPVSIDVPGWDPFDRDGGASA